MSINPLANRPRADACGFGNGLRRLSARDLPYNALSTARRQPGILMHVHPVFPWNLKLQQPQLPRSEPGEQPTESSQLGTFIEYFRNCSSPPRPRAGAGFYRLVLSGGVLDHSPVTLLDPRMM